MSLCRWTAASQRQRLPSYWQGSCLHWMHNQPHEEAQQLSGDTPGPSQQASLLCAKAHLPHMRRLGCMWPSSGASAGGIAGSNVASTHAGMSTLPASGAAAAAQIASLGVAATAAAAAAINEQQHQQRQPHRQLPADFLLPVPSTPSPERQQHDQQQQQQQTQQEQQESVVVPAVATATAVQPRTGIAPWISTIALCGAAAAIMYADRSSISTAIMPMSDQFGWDKRTGGAVMSAFLAGYGATQILGGQLSDRYGGRAVLAGGLALWSLATLLTPAAAAHSAGTLLAVRAVLGLGQGVAFPAIHAMIARGVPKHRRSRAIGAVMACAFAGSALAFGASPALIHALGWPSVFYCFSAASAVWLVAALTMKGPLTTASAQQQQGQQGQQRQQQQQQQGQQQQGQQKRHPVGMSPLLRRKEVWAIAATQYCSAWSFFSLLAWLPTFFSEHYGIQLSALGGYTIAPYLLQGCVAASAGLLVEGMMRKGWRVRSIRVGMQTAAMLAPAVCTMAAVSPLGAASPAVAAGLITAGMGMSALACNGVSANHLDIAPNNSGKVFGFGNTCGTLAGILSVPATGALLHATGSWPLVFGIAAAHNVAGAVIFSLWAGSEPLPEDGGSAAAPAATALPVSPCGPAVGQADGGLLLDVGGDKSAQFKHQQDRPMQERWQDVEGMMHAKHD